MPTQRKFLPEHHLPQTKKRPPPPPAKRPADGPRALKAPNEQLIVAIENQLREGAHISTAIGMTGVPVRRVQAWLDEGAEDEPGTDPMKVELYRRCQIARAEQDMRDVKDMNELAVTDIRAKIKIIEMHNPGLWSPGKVSKQQIDVRHTHEDKDAARLRAMTDEEFQRVLAAEDRAIARLAAENIVELEEGEDDAEG